MLFEQLQDLRGVLGQTMVVLLENPHSYSLGIRRGPDPVDQSIGNHKVFIVASGCEAVFLVSLSLFKEVVVPKF